MLMLLRLTENQTYTLLCLVLLVFCCIACFALTIMAPTEGQNVCNTTLFIMRDMGGIFAIHHIQYFESSNNILMQTI